MRHARHIVAVLLGAFAAVPAWGDPCCQGLVCVDLPPTTCVAQGGLPGFCFNAAACGAPSCDLGGLRPINDLRLAKSPGPAPANVRFAWSADPAADRYGVWFVLQKQRIPACSTCAGASPVLGSAPTFVPAALHLAAVPGPARTLYYYNTRAECLDSAATGACCTGSSCSRDTPTACAQAGGVFAGSLDCGDVTCPVPVGACCLAAGCVLVAETACRQSGGTWLPPPLPCPPACPVPTGACCTAGTCRETTVPDCTDSGGSYQGEGSTCAGSICSLGACCAGDRTCTGGMTATSCSASGGNYRGNGSTCATQCPGPPGACCRNAACTSETEASCAASGTWNGPGSTCASTLCASACCVGIACSLHTAPECLALGGDYGGDGVSCAATDCSRGACCTSSGCIEALTSTACVASGGTWRGSGSTCPGQSFCRGACCTFLACVDALTTAECQSQGGAPQGDGTVCDASSCSGACCLVRGCAVLPVATCLAGGGFPSSSGATCWVRACGASLGKCCGLFGCLNVTREQCECYVGTFEANQSCPIEGCNPGFGACCLPGGSCLNSTGSLCLLQGGTYRPDAICDNQGTCTGTSPTCPCTVTPCPTGACCGLDTGCEITNESDCCCKGGAFEAGATTCSPTCDVAPCCLAGRCVLLAPSVCADEGGSANGCTIGGPC